MSGYRIREYITENGRSPFNDWLSGLRDLRARARIRIRLDRVKLGNLGDYASVGEGVFEIRLFYGPGYRIYFGFEAKRALILLFGGTKHTQRRDILLAHDYLADYRKRNDSKQ